MPVGSGYAEMEAAMAQGRVAMMINGPWAWVNLQAHGHRLRRGAHSGRGRQAGRALRRHQGPADQPRDAPRELAVEFIENYLLTLQGLRASTAPSRSARRPAAPTTPNCGPTRPMARKVAGIMASARDGVPTPSIPRWAASGRDEERR
jgi:maltose/maltodextrin transport system substrate-binding protein